MAAYASVQNVQEEFKNTTFSSTSQPTDTRVTRYIQEEEAIINAKVGMIYTAPVDATASPLSTIILRKISISMVSRRVKEILEVQSESTDTNQAAKKDSTKPPEELLQEIVDRVLVLPDAVLLSTTNGATSYDSASADCNAKFKFKKGSGRYGGPNQW
jgi:hypothetical protein